jgi:hypothetical protein
MSQRGPGVTGAGGLLVTQGIAAGAATRGIAEDILSQVPGRRPRAPGLDLFQIG